MTDPSSVAEMLRTEFAEQIFIRLDALEAALAESDIAAALAQAHRLRGSSLVLELAEVASRMTEIDGLLRASPPEPQAAMAAVAAARSDALRELGSPGDRPGPAPMTHRPVVPAAAADRPCVLLIEDDAASVRLLEQAFARRPGVALLVEATGAGGIDAAQSQRTDLILLDLGLDDLPGVEVLRRLRRDGGTTPVVVVSGNDAPGLREELVAAGASGFLPKPVDLHALDALLDGLLPGPE